MSTDEYVPSLETLLDHYEELSLTVSGDPEVAKGNRRAAERSLARVRRDIAREVLDELIADAEIDVRLGVEGGDSMRVQNAEAVIDAATIYRDTEDPWR